MAEKIGDIHLRKSPKVMALTGFSVEVLGGLGKKELVFNGDSTQPADVLFGPAIARSWAGKGRDVYVTTSVYVMETVGFGRVRDWFVGGGVE